MERHGDEIHAYLWRLLQDAADAEDVLQEAFLRAFRAYARLNHGAKARPWLYRIATHTAYTELRRRKRRADRSQPLLDEQRDLGPAPSEQMEAREEQTRVRTAVEALPSRQRAAILLRKYQGLSYLEVGRALGCSPEAARANVYQGMRRLRAALPEAAAGEEVER